MRTRMTSHREIRCRWRYIARSEQESIGLVTVCVQSGCQLDSPARKRCVQQCNATQRNSSNQWKRETTASTYRAECHGAVSVLLRAF